MLSKNISFSLYMTHGGTNWGHWAALTRQFAPDVTSYDYDAPISESGQITPNIPSCAIPLPNTTEAKAPQDSCYNQACCCQGI